jgi:hypothetical protein
MRTSIAVALLLAAVSAYGQGGDPPAPAAPRWERFVSESGRFSVVMPGRPKLETRFLKGRTGHDFRYSSYLLDLGSSAYMVSFSDYDSQTEISLDDALGGIIRSWPNNTVTGRRRTTLYGYPARTLELQTPEHRVRFRVFAQGRRLYQIGFVALRKDWDSADAEGFMSSFRLR